jgi:hypothetical protein
MGCTSDGSSVNTQGVVISKAYTENYRITAEGLTEQEVLAYMLSVQSNDSLNKFAENKRSTFLVPYGSTSLLNLGK